MKLVLWLIVAANCHFINGSSVEQRVGREAADPVVKFNKLTAQENGERLQKCGTPVTVFGKKQNQSIPIHPWIARVSDNTEDSKFGQLVVISKRHMLADGHSIRKWNLTRIFGDYSNRPAQVLSSSNVEEIPEKIWVQDCLELWSNATCIGDRSVVKPSKIMIDNFRKPRIVLLEFEKDIRKVPVCLPEGELEEENEVIMHTGRNERTSLFRVNKMHTNGWVVIMSDTFEYSYRSLLFNKTSNRFAIVGNWAHYSNVTSYQLFSSVFQYTDLICEWTGVCPPLPRVEFDRLSKEENEERLRTCGRRTEAPKLSEAIKLTRDAPWVAKITRSDELFGTGTIISQRHIITYPDFLIDIIYDQYLRNRARKAPSIISTSVPVWGKRFELGSGQHYNYNVTIRKCVDDTCQSRKNVTLHPKKIMLLPHRYAILEMGEDLGVIPVCLPLDFYTREFEDVFAVAANGSSINYWIEEEHKAIRTILETDTPEKDIIFPAYSDTFSETLINKRNFVFTVARMDDTPLSGYDTKKYLTYRPWKTEHEAICKATGACAGRMVPLKRGDWGIGIFGNGRRLETCGIVPNTQNTSDDFFGSRKAPWLVGIRTNRTSPVIHTGVIISRRHVLLDGSIFGGGEGLAELFGFNFKKQQSEMLDVVFPEEYPLPFDFDVLVKQCVDRLCTSQTEIVKRPFRVLLYDSLNPSLIVLVFDDYLPNVPICLEDEKEVEDGDELFVQQYADPDATVLSVTDASILTSQQVSKSKVLVREKGNRTVLVGNWPLPGFSNSSSGFTSIYALRFKICELTGVCHPYLKQVQREKISEQEDKERSKTCGVLPPRHHQSPSLKEPSIARDAPWIVGVQGTGTRVHTGAVISRRHVLFDGQLLDEDVDGLVILGYTDPLTSSVPLPRTNLELRVKLRVCEDDECSTSKEIEMIPTKITVYTPLYKLSFLEFDQDLPVPPICVADSGVRTGDQVLVQDYLDPKSSQSIKLVDFHDANRPFVVADSEVIRKSRMIVTQVDGRFAIVGHRVRDMGGEIWFSLLHEARDTICDTTGVCANTIRSTREVPEKLKSQEEDPESTGTMRRAEKEQ